MSFTNFVQLDINGTRIPKLFFPQFTANFRLLLDQKSPKSLKCCFLTIVMAALTFGIELLEKYSTKLYDTLIFDDDVLHSLIGKFNRKEVIGDEETKSLLRLAEQEPLKGATKLLQELKIAVKSSREKFAIISKTFNGEKALQPIAKGIKKCLVC